MISYRQSDLLRHINRIGHVEFVWVPEDNMLSSYEFSFSPKYKDTIRDAFVKQGFSLNLHSEKDIRAFKIMGKDVNEGNLKQSVSLLVQSLKRMRFLVDVETRRDEKDLVLVIDIFK